jgi:hypothetical protein
VRGLDGCYVSGALTDHRRQYYQCALADRDPSTLPREEPGRSLGGRQRGLRTRRWPLRGSTACRPLEVLSGHLRYRRKRKPEGTAPAGSISSGLSTPTNVAHVCIRAGEVRRPARTSSSARACRRVRAQRRRLRRFRDEQASTWLLVSLLYDRCLARLGLGARAVAPNSAAHACRVALTWPAQSRASSLGGERLKRGLLCSK